MFERYAIFYTPTGDLADFGAVWLGWDSASGRARCHMDLRDFDVAQITATPRKYGLHGTLKAPFRLAEGVTQPSLEASMAEFSAATTACRIGTLELQHRHGFIALRPAQHPQALQDLAADVVRAFDAFRAPLSPEEIARRRKSRLSARQDNQMLAWGYPFVFEDFQFHMTLSGRLPPKTANPLIATLEPRLRPHVPAPFVLDAITLMGEDSEGMFHQIHRYAFTG